MAVEIQYDSAQDEVCTELWEVLQQIKKRTLAYIGDNPHDATFSSEVNDMLFLMNRVSDVYRLHAEREPSRYAQQIIKESNELDGWETTSLMVSGGVVATIRSMNEALTGSTQINVSKERV